MLLPSLIFGAEVKGARVLEVWWQDDGLITSLTWQLNAKVPRIQCHKGKLKVLAKEMFLSKIVKGVDGVAKSSSLANMLPGKSGETRWSTGQYRVSQ